MKTSTSMNPRLARLLTRLYPPAWRDRYGEEFQALLELGPGDALTIANSIRAALREHIIPTRGHTMDPNPTTFTTMIKRPSAYLPLVMSLTALTVVLIALTPALIAHTPIVRDPDEGSIAHIWQLLMTIQMPIVLFFAIKWLRRAPGQTLRVLALQAGAWLASCAPIYFLHL
jgi:hypothetical protein